MIIDGWLILHYKASLDVLVRGPHHPLGGASVALDGRKAGMKRVMKLKTNKHGWVVFKLARITKKGKVSIKASKHGFKTKTKTLAVHA
jgi:hypothetical protein